MSVILLILSHVCLYIYIYISHIYTCICIYIYISAAYKIHIHIQSEAHLESSRISAVELFCGNSQRVKGLAFFVEELHRECLTVFLMRPCPVTYYSLKKV